MSDRDERSRLTSSLLLDHDGLFESELIETLTEAGFIYAVSDGNMTLFRRANDAAICALETNVPSVDEILARGRSLEARNLVYAFFSKVFLVEENGPQSMGLARAARNLSGSVPEDIAQKMKEDKQRLRNES